MSADELPGLNVEQCRRPPIEALRHRLHVCIVAAQAALQAVQDDGCLDNTDGFEDCLESCEGFGTAHSDAVRESRAYARLAEEYERDCDTKAEDAAWVSSNLLRSLANAIAACAAARADIANAEAAEIAQLQREASANFHHQHHAITQ